MDYFNQIIKKVTPLLIEDITRKIKNNYTIGIESPQSKKGIFIPDNLGISVLADDSANEPRTICLRYPIPQTNLEIATFLVTWETMWGRLGCDENLLPEAILNKCFEFLEEGILDIKAVAKLVGAYHVKNKLTSGIDLDDQVSKNKQNVNNRILEAQFSIFLEDDFIEFESVIGRRLPIRKTA